MSDQLEVSPDALRPGSVIRHRNLCVEHTVEEISDRAVRTSCEDQEYVFPRDHLAAELSAGRFEVVSS
jgi:hypothetical protein